MTIWGRCMTPEMSLQVYEYMDSDLEVLIRDRATIISPADVKSYMQMVLQSLLACKQHWVLHRDIKPSNFLVSSQGKAIPITSSMQHCTGILPSPWWVQGAAAGNMQTQPLDISAYCRRDEVDRLWAGAPIWEP